MANQPSNPPPPSNPSSSSLPPRQSLLQNLTTQSLLLTQLFTLLSYSSSNTPQTQGIEQIYTALQLSTLDLSNLLRETYTHQEEYQKLLDKKQNLEKLEGRVRGIIRVLEADRVELEGMVERGRKVREGIEQSEKNPINIPTLLSHSQNLSRFSSAPISTLMSDIDKNQYQPWPTEMAMRMGLLFQMSGNEGMGGMGRTGEVGDETKPTEIAEQPQPTIIHEEPSRRYDPNAVFTLDLNSDDSDDD
ncbi:hypothetical protein I302_101339 [Kwoniella bestiolae CBS 10118]|uniref:Mediator of RNA polymerase II transcription subunit 4 n=1 Tax=Kwoniella bestiolae CBS 10118 TaxID=1296100 RepID=A0A1B9GBZ1_9TREE|nr:hypothetical protein I302_00022 [Kwoniella bestiolae CBS 10118]OCF28535.1 hypothetical protein I302_00022 [Kwoniella bestiolae CBS 10118]